MTERILVVAENRSLSLGLTGQDFDVADLRPAELPDWLAGGEPADLMVVGVDNPADALDIVAACREQHAAVPALLVASNAPGWSSIYQVGDASVDVLTLPITRLSLVNAVHRALHAASPIVPAADDPTPGTAPLPDPTPTAAAVPEPAAEIQPEPAPEPAAEIEPEPVPEPVITAVEPDAPVIDPEETHHRIVSVRSTDGLRERLANRPVAVTERPESALTVDAAPPRVAVTAPSEAPAPTHRTTPREQAAEWSQLREAVADDEPAPMVRAGSARDDVARLLARVDELVDVRDAANALVEEAASLAGADYGAVLLPDGGVWRVCGATGVRPLEWRYVVEADSWLAVTVIDGGRGVIVEDSDIARQRLGGAPLAHHQHLLAAPIPRAEGLVVLARDSVAFDESQLSAVATACADAGGVLADALQVRALARALSDFRGVDD